MSEDVPAAEPAPQAPVPLVSATVTVLAAGVAAVLVFPAVGARSGSGDGFGDLLPLFLMVLSVPPMSVGVLLALVAAKGRSLAAAVAAAAVLSLGALLTVPVLGFGTVPTTLVSACAITAALAALTMVTVIGLPKDRPGARRP